MTTIPEGSFEAVPISTSSCESDKDMKIESEFSTNEEIPEQNEENIEQQGAETIPEDVKPSADEENEFQEEEEYVKPRKTRSRKSRSSERSIADKFDRFVQSRESVVISIDESKVNYAPPGLRNSLNTLIKNVKRWSARKPTGASLEALQVLAERLDEFLELQTRRDDPEYDDKARELLRMIYENTSEAQRLARNLKEAAAPRPIDEY